MIIKKLNPVCVACCLLVALAPAAWGAGLWVNGDYDNFDVVNDTGQEANDFHIYFPIGTFNPNWLGDWIHGEGLWTHVDHYQNAEVEAPGDGGWEIRWTNGTTSPGQTSHFGIAMDRAHDLSDAELYWTQDGTRIGEKKSSRSSRAQSEGPFEYSDSFIVELEPRASIELPLWLKRRVYTSADLITLDDLLRGGPVWTAATVLDVDPILFDEGTTIYYGFTLTPGMRSYVMMYDVYADVGGAAGPRTMTYLHSYDITPEPASGLLVAAGALAVMRRKRRKAQAPQGSNQSRSSD